jgi:Cation efflux family
VVRAAKSDEVSLVAAAHDVARDDQPQPGQRVPSWTTETNTTIAEHGRHFAGGHHRAAIAAAVVSINRLAHPVDLAHLWAVAIAAVVGFFGNELAAQVRIRTGKRIGSAALVADGLHARTDAITSLAVLLSVGGAALGWRWADPVIGLLITVAIAMVTYTAAKQVVARAALPYAREGSVVRIQGHRPRRLLQLR